MPRGAARSSTSRWATSNDSSTCCARGAPPSRSSRASWSPGASASSGGCANSTSFARSMRVLSVVGTRPNLMKTAPVVAALERRGVEQVLVHTGQHYDASMSDVFFRDLGIREPNHFLAVGSATHAEQAVRVMQRLEPILLEEQPDGGGGGGGRGAPRVRGGGRGVVGGGGADTPAGGAGNAPPKAGLPVAH